MGDFNYDNHLSDEQSKIDEDSLYERKQEEWDILADKGEEF
ncbi:MULTISPECIES: hypothetical protein [Companilactobacillus]|jgi:hypothetical protein|nr:MULTISPECIES: hypothetical protein [Companilactobacillus]WCG36291.1 hypothetical protein PML84_03720 [Companilactobacillus farciminis]GAQ01504.1 hypothetical protein NBRC111452_1313 [Companilactobacillus farciminis]